MVHSIIEEVRKLQKEGKIDLAIKKLEDTLQSNPNFIPALNQLAAIDHKQKKFDSAIELYQRALKLKPNHAITQARLANVVMEKGNFKESIALYQKAISMQSELPIWAYQNLANALEQYGQVDEAIDVYHTTIKLFSYNYILYCNLGSIYLKKGLLADAIKTYQQAVKLEPYSCPVSIHRNLAKALVLQSRENELGSWIELSIEKAKQLIDEGKLDDAISICKKTIDLNPKLVLNSRLSDCYLLLREALCKKGESDLGELYGQLAMSVLGGVAQQDSLEYLVKKLSKDQTIIITMVSDLYFDLFKIWYSYFEKHNLKNLLVVTLDPIVNRKVKDLGVATYLLNIFAYQKNFATFILWCERVKLWKTINSMNIDLIFTGVDSLFLRNPLEIIGNLPDDIIGGIARGIPKMLEPAWDFVINADFIKIKANKKTKAMLDLVIKYAIETNDQNALNQVLFDNITSWELKENLSYKGKCKGLELDICVLSENEICRNLKFLNTETYVFQPGGDINSKLKLLKKLKFV